MRRLFFSLLGLLALLACSRHTEPATGVSEPDLGWLFLGKAPYTLITKVEAAPGPASFHLVKDLSLMDEKPEVILNQQITIAPDSTFKIKLGALEPGFYEVRIRDSVRFNIGVRPDKVLSPSDAQPDFDAFWRQTLTELSAIPLEPEYTLMPEYSNELRTCYQVRYASWGGADGKYPVHIQYMGYGAEP